MDDSILISRRHTELESANQRLLSDIARCREHIAQNEAELAELKTAAKTLERLRGARRSGSKQSHPIPPARFDKQNEKSQTVGEIIKAVLNEAGGPMRACDNDRAARARFDRPFHQKRIGKDFCRLFNEGKLLKDKYTKENSLRPEMGSDQTLNGRSLPYQSPTKGCEAAPGGVN